MQRHSRIRDWMDLCRVSNLPTIVSDSLLGISIGIIFNLAAGSREVEFLGGAIEVVIGMCCFYAAGMVLNGIVDRDVDARERPSRPIASGRIRMPWAWTGFITLMFLGFFLRPTSTGSPIPVAVAGLIGVWLLSAATSMRSSQLRKLALAWCGIAIIAALWWAIDMVFKVPPDLDPVAQFAHRAGSLFLDLSTLFIAVSLVAYNLLHQRTAWSVVFLAICRMFVPITLMLSITVPSGAFASHWTSLWSTNSFAGWFGVASAFVAWFGVASAFIPGVLAIHTVMLSLLARREVAGEGVTYRCAKCAYPVHCESSGICSECGCTFRKTPPLADRPLATRIAWSSMLIAPVALIPLLVIYIPTVWSTVMYRSAGGGFLSFSADFYGLFLVPGWVLPLTNLVLFLVTAIWFIIASTRAYRAALTHPSRRPGAIGSLIAAFALLDACGAAILHSPIICISCIGLWFITRWAQRKIPGS